MAEKWYRVSGIFRRGIIFRRINPASILRKSTSGRHRPVSYPDGPMTARYRFMSNADWESIAKNTCVL